MTEEEEEAEAVSVQPASEELTPVEAAGPATEGSGTEVTAGGGDTVAAEREVRWKLVLDGVSAIVIRRGRIPAVYARSSDPKQPASTQTPLTGRR